MVRADLAELGLGEVKVAVVLPTQPAVSSQGCVALGCLLGRAMSAQSSGYVVTEVVLRTSEPRLLLDTLTQAQDSRIALWFLCHIYLSFFTVSFRSLYAKTVFPKSPATAQVGAVACA